MSKIVCSTEIYLEMERNFDWLVKICEEVYEVDFARVSRGFGPNESH